MDQFIPVASRFRFYEDDGSPSESDSTAISGENANVTRENTLDNQLHIRYMIEEQGLGDFGGDAADDYQLQKLINGAGSWTDVNGSSTRCRSDTSSELINGNATTNRSTDGLTDPGSGSFAGGEQEEADGNITFNLTANNFLELVYAIELVAADNADADTINFRLRLNGLTFQQDQNPRITIEKITQTDQDVGDYDQNPLGALQRQTSKTMGGYDQNPLGALSAGKLSEQAVGGYDQNPLGALARSVTRGQAVGGYDQNPVATLVRKTSKAMGGFDQNPLGVLSRKMFQDVGGFDENPLGDLTAAKLALQATGGYDQNPLGTLAASKTTGQAAGGYDENPVAILIRKTSKSVGGFDQNPLATLARVKCASKVTGGYTLSPTGVLIRKTSKTVGGYDENPLGVLGTVLNPATGLTLQDVGDYDQNPIGTLIASKLNFETVGEHTLSPLGDLVAIIPPPIPEPDSGAYPTYQEHRSRIRRTGT